MGKTWELPRDLIFSPMSPHDLPSHGPWFEGWFTRITDVDGKFSVAVVGGSFMPKSDDRADKNIFPGYLAILVNNGGTLQTFEFFPERTSFQKGRPFQGKIAADGEYFVWTAEGLGAITPEFIEISAGPNLSFKADFYQRQPWSGRSSYLGPEGIGSFIPKIPLHWFVYSLGSGATYTLDSNGLVRSSKGFAHQEKNWGRSFPSAWVWSQGIYGQNEAQYALAGGQIDARLPVTSWMIGYRSDKLALDFSPAKPGTKYKTEMSPCAGAFNIKAENSDYIMEMKAQAPPDSFNYVSIPTARGFQRNGGVESFSTKVLIEIYKNDARYRASGQKTVIDQKTFENAALEFGAKYMCR